MSDTRETQADKETATKRAVIALFESFNTLKALGWQEAKYCPKDGSPFEVIEAGSTGIHRCHYSGEWPDGTYWIEDTNDLWPSRPILFRPLPSPPQAPQEKP